MSAPESATPAEARAVAERGVVELVEKKTVLRIRQC